MPASLPRPLIGDFDIDLVYLLAFAGSVSIPTAWVYSSSFKRTVEALYLEQEPLKPCSLEPRIILKGSSSVNQRVESELGSLNQCCASISLDPQSPGYEITVKKLYQDGETGPFLCLVQRVRIPYSQKMIVSSNRINCSLILSSDKSSDGVAPVVKFISIPSSTVLI